MGRNPASEANICLTSQQIIGVDKNWLLVPALSEMNPVGRY
jgi:hypothetical protein